MIYKVKALRGPNDEPCVLTIDSDLFAPGVLVSRSIGDLAASFVAGHKDVLIRIDHERKNNFAGEPSIFYKFIVPKGQSEADARTMVDLQMAFVEMSREIEPELLPYFSVGEE